MADKHIHIFEYERKDRLFTGLIVCSICGAYLSSTDQASVEEKAASRLENQREA